MSTATRSVTPTSPADQSSRFRPEIQALRALAVVGVVVYHLYPGVLRGGFAGVDVFFVISGYLITSHLLRELQRTGRVGFAAFYARRARRLLPAAFVVLIATGLLTFLVLPERYWTQVLQEIGASALYVENWVLAADSVDYLAQNIDIASPTQHYWSLSVEEQFYLVWPVLLLLGWWAASTFWRGRAKTVLTVVLGVVFVGSLAASVVDTALNPGPAYFTTQTRAWEFAAGGLLGLLLVRSERFAVGRAILAWAGLAAIAVTFVAYNGAMPFPGSAALLPVLGTVAVIAAGQSGLWWSPKRLIGLAPVQFAGDISYSLYLWHWPLAVFAVALLRTPGPLGHLGVAVLALLLAVLTKRYVEDRTRSAAWLTRRRPRFTLALTAFGMAAVLVAVTGATVAVDQSLAAQSRAAAAELAKSGDCLGAGSVGQSGCANVLAGGTIVPGTAQAPHDAVITPECWSRDGDDTLRVCSEGPTSSPALRVALIGDSHANQYQAALEQLASRHRWHVDFIGKSSCSWSTTQQLAPDSWNASCDSWRAKLEQWVLSVPYDLIITSYSATLAYRAAPGMSLEQTLAEGFADAWRPVTAKGAHVVAIKDNARPRLDFLDCIDAHGKDSSHDCVRDQTAALRFVDGQHAASLLVKRASVVDLTEYFCQERICPAVIGDVIVYRDRDHLTSSYARTLAPMLRAAILKETGLKEKPAA